jgi:hypothetical protein
MIRPLVTPVLAFGILGSGAALAADRCTVPMTEWQPREALQQKLQAAGWKLNRLKTDDGCYEADAIDDKGRRVEAYFDPKTLETVKVKVED